VPAPCINSQCGLVPEAQGRTPEGREWPLMDLSAAHVGFTLIAYIISGLALLGLAGAILLRARHLRRRITWSFRLNGTPGDWQ
jgi:hypothetical protein